MPADFQAWDLLGLFIFALIGAAVSFFGIKRDGSTTLTVTPGQRPKPRQPAAR